MLLYMPEVVQMKFKLRQVIPVRPAIVIRHKGFQVNRYILLNKIYKNKFGEVAWKNAGDGINDGFINFNKVNQIYNWAVGYGLIYIDSPDEKEVQFRFGTDDEVKIWLNNKEIWRFFQEGPAFFDDNKTTVKLKKGLNKVLIKVCNIVSDWGFFFRVTDEQGIGILDIEFISAESLN